MKFDELLMVVGEVFPEVLDSYDKDSQRDVDAGDTLALFVVRELHDVYEPCVDPLRNLRNAKHVIERAISDLRKVSDSFENEIYRKT